MGAGGIMLPNHTPLKVAETFRVLHALYPDRIDLGVGRAPGGTALEAWALGKPVLANAASAVLRGQCIRSNGGLCYQNADEFAGMLQAIEQNRWLSASLGKNGRQYVRDHYDWRVIERKYHELLVQLQKAAPKTNMEPIPGWSARRRRDVAPAGDVVRSLA